MQALTRPHFRSDQGLTWPGELPTRLPVLAMLAPARVGRRKAEDFTVSEPETVDRADPQEGRHITGEEEEEAHRLHHHRQEEEEMAEQTETEDPTILGGSRESLLRRCRATCRREAFHQTM